MRHQRAIRRLLLFSTSTLPENQPIAQSVTPSTSGQSTEAVTTWRSKPGSQVTWTSSGQKNPGPESARLMHIRLRCQRREQPVAALDRGSGQQDAVAAAAGPLQQAVLDLGEADPRPRVL